MAVTENQITPQADACRGSAPSAASKHHYERAMCFLDSAGRATDVVGSGLNLFGGIVVKEVDNSSGAAGDLNVEFWREGKWLLTGTGFTLAKVGQPVFATDNYTISLTNDGSGVYVGIITDYVDSTHVWVDIERRRDDGTIRAAVAVNNVNDTTPTNAELITSFGAAASRGPGFVGVVNDAAGGTNFYLVATDGVTYFWTKMTKAL